MVFGLYGLTGDQSTLRYVWPERELTREDLTSVSHNVQDAERVNAAVDQIMCKADGTFQIQTKDSEKTIAHTSARTEALGEKTNVFLEMMITTDRVGAYSPIDDRPKAPLLRMDAAADHRVSFDAAFSGVDHDLDSVVKATMPTSNQNQESIRWDSNTLKGILVGHQESPASDAHSSQQPGTILSVKFPLADDVWRVKSFLFE